MMKRVLIVATDPAIRTLTAIFLEHLGYQIDVAVDLASGICAVQHADPDAVLLVSDPGRLPAREFLHAYAAAYEAGEVRGPSPVAVLATDWTADVVTCPFVQGSLRMPFSLDALERLVWGLTANADELSVGTEPA